jgi:hypothetical protein
MQSTNNSIQHNTTALRKFNKFLHYWIADDCNLVLLGNENQTIMLTVENHASGVHPFPLLFLLVLRLFLLVLRLTRTNHHTLP